MIDVIPEPVDSPVPTGLASANSSTNNTPPLVWQMASEDNLSMEEEVVADLKFCYSVVGGPTSMPLKIVGLIVDLAGDVTIGVVPVRPCWTFCRISAEAGFSPVQISLIWAGIRTFWDPPPHLSHVIFSP